MKRRHLLLVAWPSFVIAGVLEMLVFSAARPEDMKGLGGVLADMTPTGVYTVVFLCFWAICAAGTLLTLILAAPTAEEAGQ